ncbi:MAG: methyltransferase domain-containing protein [Magnetococcus sp. YQC-9]
MAETFVSSSGFASLISADVVFTVQAQGLLASNFRVGTHVWLGAGLVGLLIIGETHEPPVARDLTRFSNLDGLLADPTRLDRSGESPLIRFGTVDAALVFLEQRFILVRDPQVYDRFFQKKSSILDRQHAGTFHQQLGVELLLKLRVNPDRWWYEQKFDAETGRVKPTLYKFVQEAFLERYFSSLALQDATVLDFGCGSGMASSRFAAQGVRRIIGVDPNQALLNIASERIGEKFVPVWMDLSREEPLSELGDDPVDLVWMADVLMFYFYPIDGKEPFMPPDRLLNRVCRSLAPNGRCVIMQPHGAFWLAPWLGSPERPFTVLTEYAERLYSVTPSLEELSEAIERAGLTIRRIHEPKAEEGKGVDPRAFHFARQFPLWWVFECVPARS